jgi:hypothetical protein
VLRAAAANTLVPAGKGSERLYHCSKIATLERGEASR